MITPTQANQSLSQPLSPKIEQFIATQTGQSKPKMKGSSKKDLNNQKPSDGDQSRPPQQSNLSKSQPNSHRRSFKKH